MALFGGGKIQWPSGQRPYDPQLVEPGIPQAAASAAPRRGLWPSGQRPDNDPRWAEPIFPPVKWVNGHPQTEPAMVGGPRMVGGNPKAAPRVVGGIPQAAASTAPRVIGGIPQAAASTAPRTIGGILQAAPRATPRMIGGILQADEGATPRMVGGIPQAMKKGGSVKAAASRIKSSASRSASRRADGIAQRGKTKGRIV